MAELTVKIDPADVAERVIDEIPYKGKTIREWADALTDPKTNADRFRAMSDEEMAEFFTEKFMMSLPIEAQSDEKIRKECYTASLDWLKSPAELDGANP